MAYIGKSPIIGNFVKLDAITAVNGQAAYTIQNGSVNFTDYSTVNQFLVSLNGTIQSPGSSFTVSGSTLTFASNLSTGDVIDFIVVFGNSLSAGTPTDGTVTSAKLSGALVTPSTLDLNGNTLILDADADTSIVASTDDVLEFKTGGTDRLTIKNDGVGIGVTSSSAPLEVRTNLSSDTQSTPETVLTLATKYASTGSNGAAGAGSRLEFQIPDDETNPITGAAIAGLKENGDDSNAEAALAFYISQNDTTLDEAMRINSSGKVLVNGTSTSFNTKLLSEFAGGEYGMQLNSTATSGTQYHLTFTRGGTEAGYLTSTSATAVALNNSSDERLKENIQNSGSAIQDLKDMKVRQFDWKDEIDTHKDFGFVAQELVNVVPEAVVQGSDELNENGRPVRTWGVDYSHIVPRLVKVCQEQQTKIEELEARITTLENA